jgi:hypothetical protein
MNTIKQVHVRSKRALKGRSGWSGPDTYVAVTIAPEGVNVPYTLNRSVLSKRGIGIKYFGDGYSDHTTMRSALGRALAAARAFAESKEDVCR